MDGRGKIIERARRLREMTVERGCTLAEAENAAWLLGRIMESHGITDAALRGPAVETRPRTWKMAEGFFGKGFRDVFDDDEPDIGELEKTWRTKDGRTMMIADMDERHLQNALRWTEDNIVKTERTLHRARFCVYELALRLYDLKVKRNSLRAEAERRKAARKEEHETNRQSATDPFAL